MRTLQDALNDHHLSMVPSPAPTNTSDIFPDNLNVLTRDYNAPHFHVYYAQDRILFCVTTVQVIEHLAQLEQALGRELGIVPAPVADNVGKIS